jgi:hypothetical protein
MGRISIWETVARKLGGYTWTINRMMGFLGSKCMGFTPSSTPPCGAAFGAAVAVAAADDTRDDMGKQLAGKLSAPPADLRVVLTKRGPTSTM